MATVPPSAPQSRDDDEPPLFADSAGIDRPFDAPVVRRRSPSGAAPAPPLHAPPPLPPVHSPPSQAAARTASPRSIHKGLVIGRVNGQVSQSIQPVHFYGLPILVAVLVATIAAVCLYAASTMLIAVLVIFVVLTVLMSMTMRPIMALMLGIMRFCVGLVYALLVRATLLGGRAVRGTVNNTNIRQGNTLRRFQVQLASGQYLTCFMYGELTGDEPRKDDYVGMTGRRRKDHYVVRSIQIFDHRGNQPIRRVRARTPLGLRIMRWVDVASYVLAALAVATLIMQLL